MKTEKEYLKELRQSLPPNYVELIRMNLMRKGEPVSPRWILNVIYGEKVDHYGIINEANRILKTENTNKKT